MQIELQFLMPDVFSSHSASHRHGRGDRDQRRAISQTAAHRDHREPHREPRNRGKLKPGLDSVLHHQWSAIY